jgi:hypothetical protein
LAVARDEALELEFDERRMLPLLPPREEPDGDFLAEPREDLADEVLVAMAR